jgi:hypothetical protein
MCTGACARLDFNKASPGHFAHRRNDQGQRDSPAFDKECRWNFSLPACLQQQQIRSPNWPFNNSWGKSDEKQCKFNARQFFLFIFLKLNFHFSEALSVIRWLLFVIRSITKQLRHQRVISSLPYSRRCEVEEIYKSAYKLLLLAFCICIAP